MKEVGGASMINAVSGSNRKFLVVASLLSMRPYNFKALGRTMATVWRPTKGMEYKKLGNNIMLFEFQSRRDQDRVLNGSPWSFNKNLLIIQVYDRKQRPSSLVFSKTLIWIQVQDLPMGEMTMKKGKAI